MNLWQDVRFGIRMLVKDPGFTAVVVIALALGIGANTTVFTLVNAVLFKGLPFEKADRVMSLTSNNLAKGRDNMGASYLDFQDWKAQTKAFQGLAAFSPASMNLSDRSAVPERYAGARMTANSFSLIGQKPLLGRDFAPEEDHKGAAPVVILGYGIWQNRYGGDPGIAGKTIRIDDIPTVVIGVMPNGMKFPVREDLWTPRFRPQIQRSGTAAACSPSGAWRRAPPWPMREPRWTWWPGGSRRPIPKRTKGSASWSSLITTNSMGARSERSFSRCWERWGSFC